MNRAKQRKMSAEISKVARESFGGRPPSEAIDRAFIIHGTKAFTQRVRDQIKARVLRSF